MKSPKQPLKNCPCDSGKQYTSCCEPFHKGLPATCAALLMRSRYSAYALILEAYLLSTWHADSRPATLNLNNDLSRKWLGLTIKRAESTGEHTAVVEFIARYKDGGDKAERLHEVSNFILLDRWYYTDGTIVS